MRGEEVQEVCVCGGGAFPGLGQPRGDVTEEDNTCRCQPDDYGV